MSWMRTVWLVARRELKERGRTKGFIWSTIFTVLVLAAAIVLPSIIGGDADAYTVGIVGDGGEEIVATAADLAEMRATEDEPAATFETVTFATEAEAEAAVEEGDIDAAIIDGNRLIADDGGFFGDSSLTAALQEAAGTLRVQSLVAEDAAAAEIVEVLGSSPLEVVADEDAADQEARGVIAFGGLVLMYMAVLLYGTWMLTGVTEEKISRVVEVMLSALKPWQLFAGKLVGIGLLGLSQLAVILVAAVVTLRLSGVIDLPRIPVDSLVALVGWFILGFILYATLFGAAGALVSRAEDAQTVAAPMSIIALVGYFFAFAALGDPDGTVAVVGTYIPFTAPYVAPIRLAHDAITPVEMGLSVLITVATIVILVRFAGRVYAGGLLRFGARVKWREAFTGGR